MVKERQVRSVSLADGSGSVLFEVEEIGTNGNTPAEIEVARTDFNMDDICSTVQAVAYSVSKGLTELNAKRTVLEFGVEIAAESGNLTALVVKGSGKASLKITVEW